MQINNFTEEIRGDYTRFTVDFTMAGQERQLWIETEKENAKYFSKDRIDGIVVMLLPEILLKGEPVISQYPISSQLYHSLKKYLIPVLVANSKDRYHEVDFQCPTTDLRYENGRKTATGMSFGIDSLYTYYSHKDPAFIDSEYRVDLLTLFNHGALNGQYTKNQEQMREVFQQAREKAKQFAKKEGIDFLSVDTNIDTLLSQNYTVTHTYRTAGIVLQFQKYIDKYYYASGNACGEDFRIDPFNYSEDYDLFILPTLQTENTIFFSDGTEKYRFEKTEYLTNFPETGEILSVCWKELENCGQCPKCVRTLATLELLGKLEEYKNVFDLDLYARNYSWNWAKIISLRKTNIFYGGIVQKAKEQGWKFSLKIKLLAKLFAAGRLVANPKLLGKIQKILRK